MSNKRIDPIKASEHIRETYLRYLTTTFGLKEPDLAKQFRQRAREAPGLFRGPILEGTPKYKKGKSLLDLITEENCYLSQEFPNYAPGLSESETKEALPLDRELYFHQEKALRKTIGENRNIVIATGTGSGKTEGFLFPIIDHLLKERASGSLGPGVRALIVYPMNALANDQVYRLRRLLPPETGITFGRYTGQTPQTYYQGLDDFKQENANKIPQANELFCRDQILGFEPTKGDWPHKSGKLLCIATSATIGASDPDSTRTIAKSFENLFGEEFYVEDIITGDVVPPEDFLKVISVWGNGCYDFYRALWNLVNDEIRSIPVFVEKARIEIFSKASAASFEGWPDQATINRAIDAIKELNDTERASEVFLFSLLGGDGRLRFLIKELESHPIDLHRGAEVIWSIGGVLDDKLSAQRGLIDLVDLASRARLRPDSAPLLAARYHFFIRSLEGLSICLVQNSEGNGDWPRLLIGRHQDLPDAPGGRAVGFELRACVRCGQSFLHGYIQEDGRFVSYPQRMRLDEKMKPGIHLAINLDEVIESPEDEDPLREERPPVSAEEDGLEDEQHPVRTSATRMGRPRYLCPRCGFISDDNTTNCEYCFNHHAKISNEWVEVRRVYPEKGGTVKICPACGGQKHFGGSIIRSFSPGDDAAGAVLAHSLMTSIPPTTDFNLPDVIEDYQPKGRFAPTTGVEKPIGVSKGKRRLLAFSDSRQDAAYFATYLNRTADQILHRQLILKAIRKLVYDNPGSTVFDCSDLINPLILEAQEAGLFGPGITETGRKNEVCKWLTAELASIQRRYGLEGVGLVTWQLKYRQQLLDIVKSYEDGLKSDYGFNASEFVDLLEIFLSELRRRNVVQPGPNVDIKDPYFWPRNRPYSIRRNNVNSKLSIASWFPQSSRNIRSDFLERLFAQSGASIKKDKINKLLWRLRWDAWLGRLNSGKEGEIIYKCDTCGNLTHINLKNVCPTYRCPGKLRSINPDKEFEDNHYRYLYESAPIHIVVSEHTAQLTNEAGAKKQQRFCSDNEPLNVLSCSTTFELGVDVGQLYAVFMRNVPPTVGNYVQRSGRAGRRLSAAAFVLTFCRSRPHDLGYFDVTEKLIAGKVQPPRVRIPNESFHLRLVKNWALTLGSGLMNWSKSPRKAQRRFYGKVGWV